MNTKIYLLNIKSILNAPVTKYLDKFTPERREKILRYKLNPDRNRTVHAELLAKNVIAKIANTDPDSIQISRDINGKPYCNIPGIFLSLSHSGEWVACSVGDSPNGIDVEKSSNKIGIKIAKRFFLPNEYAQILKLYEANNQDWTRKFLEYWTLKESCLKCENLRDWSNVDCEKLLHDPNLEIAGRNFHLQNNYVLGICTHRNVLPDGFVYAFFHVSLKNTFSGSERNFANSESRPDCMIFSSS